MPFIKDWKTSLTGAIILAVAAAHTFLGLAIPGAMDFGAAIPIALGLILAKDAAA